MWHIETLPFALRDAYSKSNSEVHPLYLMSSGTARESTKFCRHLNMPCSSLSPLESFQPVGAKYKWESQDGSKWEEEGPFAPEKLSALQLHPL